MLQMFTIYSSGGALVFKNGCADCQEEEEEEGWEAQKGRRGLLL